MQTSLTFKTILAAGIALFIISCSNNSKEKVKITEITLQDIKQEEKDVEPPPPPPPKPEPPMINAEKKCFANDGLKYKTVVIFFLGGNIVMGNVTSEELDSGKKETTEFTGKLEENRITVKFKGNPPVVGVASEWTDKPWRIETKNGKENLHITFNAKNYESNKWEETDYEFVLCK